MQYDTKDGLAGSTVYDMCQDKDGFMWFATENGLSRYDGTNFVNFTVKDGLADNEILKVYPDSKGRVWIGGFSKEVCFYYKGKIYNKSNCTWINNIKLEGAALSFLEDRSSGILISDFDNIFHVDTYSRVFDLNTLPEFKKWKGVRKIPLKNIFYPGNGVALQINDSIYQINNHKLYYQYKSPKFTDKQFVIKYDADNTLTIATLPDTRVSQTNINNYTYLVSTLNGSWLIDTVALKLKLHLLPGKKVTNTICDNEGNFWFSTIGQGVYKLPSLGIKNIDFKIGNNFNESEIFCLESVGGNLIAGMGFSKAAIIMDGHFMGSYDFQKLTKFSINNSSSNRLNAIYFDGKSKYFGFDAFLLKVNDDNSFLSKDIIANKSIAAIDDKQIVVANFNGVYRINKQNLAIVDTIYKGRSTRVLYYRKNFYVGTLNGLYVTQKAGLATSLSKLHSSLSRRITDLRNDKFGNLWVATNDSGVIGINGNRVVSIYNDGNGLSSNICKSLYCNDRYLYVGTNRGVNIIDIVDTKKPIIKYTISDGLPSDIINAIYVKDSNLYIGTPKGITFFNEQIVIKKSICNLQILQVITSAKDSSLVDKMHLNYFRNRVKFNYIAISFKSTGNIAYYYKLSGLDNIWHSTSENFIDYQSLEPGNYTFELYAVNKFGVHSQNYTISFVIDAPFYKKWWFSVAIFLVTFTSIIIYYQFRSRQMEKRFAEKSNYEKQFAALEQQALQAQMNPHFIFNCLNSIQQFILTNEREKANLYLTDFASLIRRTLYISSKKSVTVTEEATYLRNYLEMERMRFGDSFEYEITGQDNPEVSQFELPALLLQPFVENSLRHGLRYKKDGTGITKIIFTNDNEYLICTIIDNGIGRTKAAEYKNALSVEYQSKGMSVTAKRIELINKTSERHITLDVIDLVDKNGNAEGTEIIIKIPV